MNRPTHPTLSAMHRLTCLSIHASLSEFVFEGKQAGHVLKRLADRGLVTLHERTIPAGITYVRLSAEEVSNPME